MFVPCGECVCVLCVRMQELLLRVPRVHAPTRIQAGANTRARVHGYTPAQNEANDDYGISSRRDNSVVPLA
jgi:hypothetical protein